jgi:hypothetical protein
MSSDRKREPLPERLARIQLDKPYPPIVVSLLLAAISRQSRSRSSSASPASSTA